jgi:hypothetical protein
MGATNILAPSRSTIRSNRCRKGTSSAFCFSACLQNSALRISRTRSLTRQGVVYAKVRKLALDPVEWLDG